MALVMNLAQERPVVIFSRSTCCMSHSVVVLIRELGAYPVVYELDQHPQGRELERALKALRCNPVVPTVFIGGRKIGGANDVMELHISGNLKRLLIEAGAIFL